MHSIALHYITYRYIHIIVQKRLYIDLYMYTYGRIHILMYIQPARQFGNIAMGHKGLTHTSPRWPKISLYSTWISKVSQNLMLHNPCLQLKGQKNMGTSPFLDIWSPPRDSFPLRRRGAGAACLAPFLAWPCPTIPSRDLCIKLALGSPVFLDFSSSDSIDFRSWLGLPKALKPLSEGREQIQESAEFTKSKSDFTKIYPNLCKCYFAIWARSWTSTLIDK